MIVPLVLGSIIDLLLAVVWVSGFVFGPGPEGSHGEIGGVLMWSFGLLMCLGCPVAGFALRAKGQPGTGIAVCWLPVLGALLVTFFPYHPC